MLNSLGIKQSVFMLLLLAMLVTVLYLLPSGSDVNEDNYLELSGGWDINVAGEEFLNTNISDVFFDAPGIGDVVTLTTVLPENDIHYPIIRMYSIHSTVEVYIDGEEIYEYGVELYNEHKLLGYGYHYIELPTDYIGKTLQVVMCVSENDSFTSLNTPKICNSNTVTRDFVINNRVPLAIILFLVTFGMCILSVSAIFVFKNSEFMQLIFVGVFSIGIGMWSLCNYDLIMLFTYDIKVKTIIEYTSLFILPLPICLYFSEAAKNRHRIIHVLYSCCTFALAAFILVAIPLQAFNIVHYPAILRYFHFILMAVFLVLVGIVIYDVVAKKITNPALLVGMIVMTTMGILDIIRYNIQKYIPDFKSSNYVSKLCIGAFVFVLSQLADFGISITKTLCENAQKATLEKMAYSDALTGIYNRRKCEEEFNKIDAEGKNNYGILTFDLNNLKVTNDTKGHEMGDLLIKSFAEAIDLVYGKYGTVGRMGGDEFIVIFPNMSMINIDFMMEKLQHQIKKANEKYTGLDMSVAYGYCGKREKPECMVREIYQIADVRMYDMKVDMKGKVG